MNYEVGRGERGAGRGEVGEWGSGKLGKWGSGEMGIDELMKWGSGEVVSSTL
ncbi:MAG UNVERIFIED_CONTAM: hypothetical protein LVR29_11220 [Microcystis novacekii LVE1205-3]|jgi:hypothetical protein